MSLIVKGRKRVVNCLLIVCYADGRSDESLAFLLTDKGEQAMSFFLYELDF